jgi:hypothetical protein
LNEVLQLPKRDKIYFRKKYEYSTLNHFEAQDLKTGQKEQKNVLHFSCKGQILIVVKSAKGQLNTSISVALYLVFGPKPPLMRLSMKLFFFACDRNERTVAFVCVHWLDQKKLDPA